jgi:CrcB protein
MIGRVMGTGLSLAIVSLGGGIGCAARLAVREALVACGTSSAIAILAVNLVGAALAGSAIGWASDPESVLRITALAILSGWTTYSAFSTDVLAAIRAGRRGRAAFLWIGTIVATPVVALVAARFAGGGAS